MDILVQSEARSADCEQVDQEFDVEAPVPEATDVMLGDEDIACTADVEEYAQAEASLVGETNASRFPDAVFNKYVLDTWDSDHDGSISSAEASKVKTISVPNMGIKTLEGIELFTNLKTLKCQRNALTGLDITRNAKLSTLLCYDNPIERIDLGPCATLLKYATTIHPKHTGGTLKYTAKVSGKSKIVMNLPDVTAITNGEQIVFDPANVVMLIGDSLTLMVGQAQCVLSDGLRVPAIYNSYKSGKTAVAKISSDGIVTAVKAGNATMTVTTWNGRKLTCKVTVKAAKAPSSVSLSSNSLMLGVKQQYALKPAIPEGTWTTYTWSSSNKKIVSVKDGLLTALKTGTARITVKTKNGKKAACQVRVYAEPKTIAVEPDALSLRVGDTEALRVKLNKGAGGEISLSSEDPEIAEVNNDTGVVTAKGVGKTTLWAKCYNGLKAACAVEVTDDSEEPAGPDAIRLSETSMKLAVDLQQTLIATPLTGGEATDDALTFTSSNENVVTVTDEGFVNGVKAGSAEITVAAKNGVRAVCQVKVYNAPASITLSEAEHELEYDTSAHEGDSFRLTVKLTQRSLAEVTFASSDVSVATVDVDGLVTATGVGTAKVTATTHNGKQAVCTVVVRGRDSAYNIGGDGMVVVAHRGGYGYGEENTLAAFASSEGTGADMVELDVRTTKDGVEVIHHDASVKVNGHSYKIKDKKYSDLIKVKPNLCTLDEALEIISKTHLTLQLELKDTADAAKCVAAVKKYNMEDRVLYISFKKDQLKKIRKLAPDAKLGFCIEGSVPSNLNSTVKELKLYALMVKYDLLTESRLTTWHNAGLLINVWTINTYGECLYWTRLGVDYITSNYPADAVRARKDA